MSNIPYFKDKIAELDKRINEVEDRVDRLRTEREVLKQEMQSVCPHPDFAVKLVRGWQDEPLEKSTDYKICYICHKQV